MGGQSAGIADRRVETKLDARHAVGEEGSVGRSDRGIRKLDLVRLKELLRDPVVIDMRNVCEPAEMAQMGFRYTGVGR